MYNNYYLKITNFQTYLQNYFRKLLPKINILQNNLSSKLFRKIYQSCSLKWFPEAISQNYFPKHLSKAVAPKQLYFKPIPQSYSPKRFPKVAPQSCYRSYSPKLCFKVTSQKCSSFKAAVQSCTEQLLGLLRKVVSESGFPKLLSTTIPQSYRFSKQLSVNAVFKAAKLLPAVAPQSCSSKLLPKAASEKRSPKFQCCYPKLPQS